MPSKNMIVRANSIKLKNLLLFSKLLLIFFVTFILFPAEVFSQSIETITKSKPVTIGGNVAFNDNIEFFSDSKPLTA